MMQLKKDPIADVGVIVARFQTHELHQAHRDLIDAVCARHSRVIIFLGLSPLLNTINNPLDFNNRKHMLQEAYGDRIEVYYIDDKFSDDVWSANLDAQINKWLKPHQTCMLYGSRDSFLSHYKGSNPTQELESTLFISGTEQRRQIANRFPSSAAFRAGQIAATFNRFPTCFPTVDVAVFDPTKRRVLLGRKEKEPSLRFIGGFASPASPSYEADAKREVWEEASIEVDQVEYIGSTLIDDWRYRKETDKIKTIFFIATFVHGRPEAKDDIVEVQWVDLDQLCAGNVPVMPSHAPLVAMLATYVKKENI